MRKVFLTTTILSALALTSLPASAFEAGVGASGGASAGVGASAGGVGASAEAGVGVAAGADAGASPGAGASSAGGVDSTTGTEAGIDAGVNVGANSDAAAATSTGGTGANTTGRGILGGLFGFLNGRSAEARGNTQSGAAANTQLVGATMVSADGARLGTVTDMTADASGQAFLVVVVDDQLGLRTGPVRIRAEKTTFANQQVQLTGVTQAEFVSSLQSQLGGEAGASIR